MAGLAWDEYLFQTYKLVAVDPWSDESLALLDVFTKRGSYGIVNRGPKLVHTGALTHLTKRSEESSTTQTNLEEAHMGRGSHVKSGKSADVTATLNSSSKISASILKIVTADNSTAESVMAQVKTVTSESIDQDFLAEQVNEGRWKPDLNMPQLPKKWDHVLWVVKEIKYAKKLIIGKSTKSIVAASINPSKLVPIAQPLPSGLEGKVEAARAMDGTTVFTAPGNGRFPIGFKAIRLTYNENGDLLGPGGINFDLGEHRPKVRADNDAWLNPDSDPNYHMGDLVTQEPGGRLQSLPIVQDEED